MAAEQIRRAASGVRMRPLSFDEVMRRALFVLGMGVLPLVVFVAKFDCLSDPNAADYAQIARNVAQGKGFTTSAMAPLSLALTESRQPSPDISRPPLWVGTLAMAMKVGGASDRTVVLVSMLFVVLTMILVYYLARAVFDDTVASYAVAITGLSTALMAQGAAGLETSLLTFLVTLLFGLLLLHGKSDRSAAHWPLITGLVAGLCSLVRFECAALLPAVLIYWLVAGKQRRWAQAGLTLALFLVVTLPWAIRTTVVTKRLAGSAFSYELNMGTLSYPGQTLYRQFTGLPTLPLSVAVDHPLQLIRKLNEGLSAVYNGLPQSLNPYLLVCLLPGLLLPNVRNRYGLAQWCLLLGIFLLSVTLGLYSTVLRILVAFAPVVAILAVGVFATCYEEYARQRWAGDSPALSRRVRSFALGAWLLVLAYPMVNFLFVARPARLATMVQTMREVAARGELTVTDMPWQLAWHGGKRALYLPQTPQQLAAVQQAGVRPDALYLSPGLAKMPASELLGGWVQAAVDEKIEGFARDRTWRYSGELWKAKTGSR